MYSQNFSSSGQKKGLTFPLRPKMIFWNGEGMVLDPPCPIVA